MRICIPAADDRGLSAAAHGHFGSAPCFVIADPATGELSTLVNRHQEHRHGHCDPAGTIAGAQVDVVLCQGMGRRALAGLEAAGVQVFTATGEDVAAMLRCWSSGAAQRLTSTDACAGHGQGGEH
jgi:predicted Fe-Mo cluster-binding NifX family protein